MHKLKHPIHWVKRKHWYKIVALLKTLFTLPLILTLKFAAEWFALCEKDLLFRALTNRPRLFWVCIISSRREEIKLNFTGYQRHINEHVRRKNEYNSYVELILITKQSREKVSLECLQERGQRSGAIAPVLNRPRKLKNARKESRLMAAPGFTRVCQQTDVNYSWCYANAKAMNHKSFLRFHSELVTGTKALIRSDYGQVKHIKYELTFYKSSWKSVLMLLKFLRFRLIVVCTWTGKKYFRSLFHVGSAVRCDISSSILAVN